MNRLGNYQAIAHPKKLSIAVYQEVFIGVCER
jgi:hypothetical protein